MLTRLSVYVREGCTSSSFLTTTLPVESLCCGRPFGSAWWLLGSMVRQYRSITIHTTQMAQFSALSPPPCVISVRRRPFHGRRGSYDWLSASTLHEVVLVLHHTFCLCGKCCSVCFVCTFNLPVANSWHFFCAYRQCSCSTWWTTSPWPTTQCTLIPCGVKHLAGHWPCPPCSVSLLPFSTNYCAAKDLCGRSVCHILVCLFLFMIARNVSPWKLPSHSCPLFSLLISSSLIRDGSLDKAEACVQ